MCEASEYCCRGVKEEVELESRQMVGEMKAEEERPGRE